MWRLGGSKTMPMPDQDTIPKLPRGTAEEAKWIRKGYIVATLTLLALFPFSGFGFTHLHTRTTTTTTTTTTILNYLRTLNTDSTTSRADYEDINESSTDSTASFTTPDGCSASAAKLKVFMYDFPSRFHYGMLDETLTDQPWPRNVSALPRYPGGLYQQHSPEYWLISDVLTSDMEDRRSPCTAFRVRDWEAADVILVPFFASLSYNKYSRLGADRNEELQSELVAFLDAHPAWSARPEYHVVIIHHPNSMVAMRRKLRRTMFVVADFGRYAPEVANLRKDVVAPYKHVIPRFDADAPRPTLLFFQGAIVRKEGGQIRQRLHKLLREEREVVFATGATTSEGIRTATSGMRSSKFCLHVAGDTPSSNRLFDAVASGCVPVVVSDEIELPFEDVLDYAQFCVFVSARDSVKEGFLTGLLRNFDEEVWESKRAHLREVARHFEWQFPSAPGDAVHMTWEAVARKVPALALARHKRQRFANYR